MYTLVAFATEWGSKHGGINSFNADFLPAFSIAFYPKTQVICITSSATDKHIEEAARNHVRLVPLPYAPEAATLGQAHGEVAVRVLKEKGIAFDPDTTVWLGHDRITGEAALGAAKSAGGRSALIHHMSYAHYETYAESSQVAQEKITIQKRLLEQADLVLAIGPLLRDAARDLLGAEKPVFMLVPGLAEVDPREAPSTFVAYLSARLSQDASRIKQGRLGVAAFATAQGEAKNEGRPEVLRRQPKLILRGVDFEEQLTAASVQDPETEVKLFAEKYAGGVVNLHALRYTEDRQELYLELSRASVALMPSWHEGFGLVAWEAIAAGVPLIVSKNSGVYRLLDEEYPGAGTGSVYAVDVDGATSEPFFTDRDLRSVVALLKSIADDPNKARKQASILRNMLGERTWAACAKEAVHCFGWELGQGLVAEPTPEDFSADAGKIDPPIPVDETKGPLVIPASQWRAGMGMADSQLLRAEEALLEFDAARQPDVEKLNEWIDDPTYPLSVRLITGAGGQGKTRLALEICRQRRSQNWYAGFLDSNLDAGNMPGTWRTLGQRKQPLLIVIDYAETRQAVFLALLKTALQSTPEQPARLLLLARDGGEWWDNLSKDRDCEAFLNGYATSGPLPLRPLYEAKEERGIAFGKALAAFSETLGVSAPVFEPDLSGEHFARPLYIQIAALLALYGEQPTTAQGLTRALLNHERRYWEALLAHFGWTDPARRAEQLLALTTLAGGFVTPNAAQPYWKTAKADVITNADFNSLFRELVTLYPGSQGLQAVRPDLLGEALVSQALLRPAGETFLDAVLTSSASKIVRRNSLTVLARITNQRSDLQEILVDAFTRHFTHCCQDIIAVSKETRSQLPEAAELAFERLPLPIKSQVSGVISPMLTNESVELGRLGCRVHKYLVEKAQVRLSQRPDDLERNGHFANALYDYSMSLNRMGHYAEACEVSAKSVTHYRSLLGKKVRDIESSYAGALNNYSVVLGNLDRNEEALASVREAMEINKRLARSNPNSFESQYANSLSNYATYLSKVGNDEEAIVQEGHALQILKRLIKKDPSRFESAYAHSLGHYSVYLGQVGRDHDAVNYAKDALNIFERLAKESPDCFDPDLANSLNIYSIRLSNVRKYEEALEFVDRALTMYRRLGEKDPDRFESDYAGSLLHYSSRLSDLGRNEESLNRTRQALEIFERLAALNPDRFEPAFAKTLGNYSDSLSEMDLDHQALGSARESMAVFSNLAQKNPDGFNPDYASSLNKYGKCMSRIGKYEEALNNVTRALEIQKHLSQRNQDRFEPAYALTLSDYAICLTEIGDIEGAFNRGTEALRIFEHLARKDPNRFTADVFRLSCYCALLAWFVENTTQTLPASDQLFRFVAVRNQPLMSFYMAFSNGCLEEEFSARKSHFRNALAIWPTLTKKNQINGRPYSLCIKGWNSKFDPDLTDLGWPSDWRQYVDQRSGRIPEWMIRIARKLEFEWPSDPAASTR